MSVLRNWEKADPSGKPLGRPRISESKRAEGYALVEQEWRRQGVGSGERPVMRALAGRVRRTVVREGLRRGKSDLRRRMRRRLEENRQSIKPLYRDLLWSLDAQELCRSRQYGIVQAEMVREVASGKTLVASAGPPAHALEIVALLERVWLACGRLPLVLVTDNGGPYRSKLLARWLRRHRIVHLFNQPHTPEHNSWVERGHREHQEEMMLGAHDGVLDLEGVTAALARATNTLNHCRLRQTRAWKTASEYELALPPAAGVISRAVFHRTARQAIACAMKGLANTRERRRAEREAILATLQSFGLINRTRGGVPVPAPQRALIT